jgi:hypothetical protein
MRSGGRFTCGYGETVSRVSWVGEKAGSRQLRSYSSDSRPPTPDSRLHHTHACASSRSLSRLALYSSPRETSHPPPVRDRRQFRRPVAFARSCRLPSRSTCPPWPRGSRIEGATTRGCLCDQSDAHRPRAPAVTRAPPRLCGRARTRWVGEQWISGFAIRASNESADPLIH